MIHGKAKPMLGTPVHLKVQSRGIRSIEYSAYHRRYFLVAGDRSDKLSSVLYSWDGVPESVPFIFTRKFLFLDLNKLGGDDHDADSRRGREKEHVFDKDPASREN